MNLQRNEYVLGIDLGTTNTCAAIMTSRTPDPIVISYSDSSRLLKSCVKYSKPFDVGSAAYKHLTYGLPGVVKNSKRIIGRYYKDEVVQKCVKDHLCGAEIKEVKGKPVFVIDDTTLVSPSDVSSAIIRRVVEKADEFVKRAYGDEMKCLKIAVTFPAHFDNNQRTATLLAVEKAGISKERLTMLNEPSAAAFYYCKSNKIDNQTILVYDLGGGTFDVSIVRVEGNDYKVLKYAGNSFLGGADIDSLFAKIIETKYKEEYDVPLIDTNNERIRRRYYLRLNAIAEQTKIQLSNFETVDADLSVFEIQNKNDSEEEEEEEEEEEIMLDVTREELNNCIKELVNQTIDTVEKCVKDCNMNVSDIDRVVMIGGSSRLTMVRDRLRKLFGDEKLSGAVNPDEAVACGACLSLVEKLHLTDRIVYSLGQKLRGGLVQCLIPRQTAIKFTSKEISTHPAGDFTRYIRCAIYQGNADKEGDTSETTDQCVLIEEYKLEGYDYAPASEITFLTTFTIDEWGIIHVIDKYKEKNKVLVDKMFRWEEPIETNCNTNQVILQRVLK
ncbi:uncharacterized protein [Blastocystis hominis]|uniref:Heat shock protein 70 n=1 Tax=Blastocystis hominis TaxID=12968 RepID=D8M4K8_BLAHO|nr:uncharacterized protein [Blastocystis hominis]CBK22997.2 unnamed protein product [Blastocystis hominis]|eukprot:XP_012897045.1 uncharacterized protein [Blastocystis hominis]